MNGWGGGDGAPAAQSAMQGRMGIWLEHQLAASTAHRPAEPVAVPPSIPPGSADQDALVGALTRCWTDETAGVSVVLADRGRGKSAGVGRAIAALPSDASVVVCGPHPAAVREVLAFADRPGLTHWLPLTLLECLEQGPVPGGVDVLVVDEAAQVPLPLLQALVTAVPHAHVVLATTIHGYEGTGHGFEQRLLPWLQDQPRLSYGSALHADSVGCRGSPGAVRLVGVVAGCRAGVHPRRIGSAAGRRGGSRCFGSQAQPPARFVRSAHPRPLPHHPR